MPQARQADHREEEHIKTRFSIILCPKGAISMTEKRDIFDENNLVSATEMTGAAPRAMDEEAAETIGDITNARCSPSFAAEDPARSPLLGGNGRLSDTRNSRTSKSGSRPGKQMSLFRRLLNRNR